MKIENFFDVVHCYEEQTKFRSNFLLDNDTSGGIGAHNLEKI